MQKANFTFLLRLKQFLCCKTCNKKEHRKLQYIIEENSLSSILLSKCRNRVTAADKWPLHRLSHTPVNTCEFTGAPALLSLEDVITLGPSPPLTFTIFLSPLLHRLGIYKRDLIKISHLWINTPRSLTVCPLSSCGSMS